MIYPPTLCAVYSPLPLESFKMLFKAGNTYISGLNSFYSTSGPLGDGVWRISIVPNHGNNYIVESFDLYCRARTAWETVRSERYRIDFETEGHNVTNIIFVSLLSYYYFYHIRFKFVDSFSVCYYISNTSLSST